MVCPYCSTEMTPIELNGKVFCSNCGLTIANNSTGTIEIPQPTISQYFNEIHKDKTDTLEGTTSTITSDLIPDEKETDIQPMIPSQEEVPPTNPTDTKPIDYFGQFRNVPVEERASDNGRKLEVRTDDNISDTEKSVSISDNSKPITEEAVESLGINTSEQSTETPPQTEETPTLSHDEETVPISYVEESIPVSQTDETVPIPKIETSLPTPNIPEPSPKLEVEETIPIPRTDEPVSNSHIEESVAAPKAEQMTSPQIEESSPKTIVEEQIPIAQDRQPIYVSQKDETVSESRISDLSIPTEKDFENHTIAQNQVAPVSSYVELANPGDEKETLEAGEILLDILAEESTQKEINHDTQPHKNKKKDVLGGAPQNPIEYPEIPTDTETNEKDDVFITLNKNVSEVVEKEELPKTDFERISEKQIPETDTSINDETIEKLEEQIAKTPEPVVDISTDELSKYDPDAIDFKNVHESDQKTSVIKEYFSSALEQDKRKVKTKTKKKMKALPSRFILLFFLLFTLVLFIGVGGYFILNSNKPQTLIQEAKESATFTTVIPSNLPDGYVMFTSDYNDSTKTFKVEYVFATDKAKTITFSQILSEDSEKYISDYKGQTNTSFIEKEITGITYTEINDVNLFWVNNGFVFTIETKNFTFSNDLLYKMAETINQ
jgi:hypothetical protein